MDALDQLVGDGGADRPARQQVFGAVDFRRLGQYGAPAVGDQAVHGGTQSRVGGDAGVAVGATALQRDSQMLDGAGCPFDLVGFVQQLLDVADALGDRLGGAADLLDREGVQPGAGLQTLGLDQRVDLIGFAAEADDQHGGEVDVARVAGERTPQHLQRFAIRRHRTAHAVSQCDHAIHVGVRRHRFGMNVAPEMIGDGVSDRGGAVDRGENADVIARGDTAIRSSNPHEGGGGGDPLDGRDLAADGIVFRIALRIALHIALFMAGAFQVADAEIVDVDMIAGRDGTDGATDDLAVAANHVSAVQGSDGDLVGGGHGGCQDDARQDFGTFGQRRTRDDDIIAFVQADDRGGGLGGVFDQCHELAPRAACATLVYAASGQSLFNQLFIMIPVATPYPVAVRPTTESY